MTIEVIRGQEKVIEGLKLSRVRKTPIFLKKAKSFILTTIKARQKDIENDKKMTPNSEGV